jgi:hypothetical protein
MKCGFAMILSSHEEASQQRRQAHQGNRTTVPYSVGTHANLVSPRGTPRMNEALRGTHSGPSQPRRLACSGSAAVAAIAASPSKGRGSGGSRHTFTSCLQLDRGASGGTSTIAVTPTKNAALPNPSLKLSPNGGPRGPGRRYAVHFRQPGPRVPPSVPA